MTVPATPRRAGPFLGDGSATSFPFTFKVFSDEDLAVILDSAGAETVLTSGYSVELNADQANDPGGTVTYPLSGAAMAPGSSISVIGATPYSQTSTIPSGGNFAPAAIEAAFDRLEFQIQQMLELVSRNVVFPASSDADVLVNSLPDAASRAGRMLGFDWQGNPIVVTPSSGSASELSADLANAALATKGAGQIGHSTAVTYPAGTVGRRLAQLSTDTTQVRTDLANPLTAALMVAFQQTGTGATPRWMADELRRWATPMQFGATGGADDSDAVQRAFDSDKYEILLDRSYNVKTVRLPMTGKTIKSMGRGCGLVGIDNTKPVLRAQGAGPPYITDLVLERIRISGVYSRALSLESYSSETEARGLVLTGAATDCQIYTRDAFCSQFDHTKISGSSANAAWIFDGGSNGMTVNNLYISQNSRPYGVDLRDASGTPTTVLTFNTLVVENAACAVKIRGRVAGVTINGLYTENVVKVGELGELTSDATDARGIVITGAGLLWSGPVAFDLYNVSGGDFAGLQFGSADLTALPPVAGKSTFRIWKTTNVYIRACWCNNSTYGGFYQTISKGADADGQAGVHLEDQINDGGKRHHVTYQRSASTILANQHYGYYIPNSGTAMAMTALWTPVTDAR